MVSILKKYTVPVLGDGERLVLGGRRVAPRLELGKTKIIHFIYYITYIILYYALVSKYLGEVVLDDAHEAVQVAHGEL